MPPPVRVAVEEPTAVREAKLHRAGEGRFADAVRQELARHQHTPPVFRYAALLLEQVDFFGRYGTVLVVHFQGSAAFVAN